MNELSENPAVIITGAGGGIGRALCKAFRGAGYFVIGSDRVRPGGSDSGAPPAHCDAFVELDLTAFVENAEVRAVALERFLDAINGRKLKALINNAAAQILGPVGQLSVADWRTTLNVNLLAPFFLAQGLLDRLEAAGGTIINIGSIHARLTKPGFVAYATSKAALEGLTRSMAVELGPRVRVNAISPAAIETDMLMAGFKGSPEAYRILKDCHPVGRLGQPKEVAEAALFLTSDKIGFLSGSVIAMDGAVGVRLHDPK